MFIKCFELLEEQTKHNIMKNLHELTKGINEKHRYSHLKSTI